MTPVADDVEELLAGFAPERTNLLPGLHALHERFGYLPGWAMERLGLRLRVPASEVYGVATSYPEFRLQPPPTGLLYLCTGLSCRLAGADELLVQARARRPEAVEAVSCLFLCPLAPVALQGEVPHGRVDAALLQRLQAESGAEGSGGRHGS